MQTLLPVPGVPHRTARHHAAGESPVRVLRGLEARTRANFLAMFQGLVSYKVESRWGPFVTSPAAADGRSGDAMPQARTAASPDAIARRDIGFVDDPHRGYRFVAQPDAVASFVFGKSQWAVLGVLLLFETAAAANRRHAGHEPLHMSTLTPVSTTGITSVGWRAALIELEWRREAATLDSPTLERGLNELAELIQGVDALLQFQAPEDAGCFCHARGRSAADAVQREIESGLLAAYRRDCLEAAWLDPGFFTMLEEMIGIDRLQRMSAELAYMWTQADALAAFSND